MNDPATKAALLERLRETMKQRGASAIELQLGQCQRLCPDGHVTLTAANFKEIPGPENADPEWIKQQEELTMSDEATETSIADKILQVGRALAGS